MSKDGVNFATLFAYYTIAPWLDPIGFWRREIQHNVRTIIAPVGHEIDHQIAITKAALDGRPLDALANRINDLAEEV